MKIGQSAPQYSEAVLLFPQSKALRGLLAKYFTVVVRICHRVVSFSQQSLLGQARLFVQGLDTPKFESDLVDCANGIREELRLERARESSAAHTLVREIHAWTSGKRSAQAIQEHAKLLDRRSTFNYRSSWSRIRKQGNTTWMFDLPEYRSWADSVRSGTLHLRGKLGSGRSVLLANTVDDMVLRRPSAVVLYFFCCEDIADSLRCWTILGSIARQLLETVSLKDKSRIASQLPDNVNEEAICDLLSSTFVASSQTFLVLDGIDECSNAERDALLRSIEKFQERISLAVCYSV